MKSVLLLSVGSTSENNTYESSFLISCHRNMQVMLNSNSKGMCVRVVLFPEQQRQQTVAQ